MYPSALSVAKDQAVPTLPISTGHQLGDRPPHLVEQGVLALSQLSPAGDRHRPEPHQARHQRQIGALPRQAAHE